MDRSSAIPAATPGTLSCGTPGSFDGPGPNALVVREDDAVLDVGQGREHVVGVDGGREPRQPVRERRDLLAGEEGRPRGCVFEAED